MKNTNEVISLLAGTNRPTNARVAAEVLQLLSTTEDAYRDPAVTHQVVDLLRCFTDNATDAAKITLAMLIALPASYDDVFLQVISAISVVIHRTGKEGVTNIGDGRTDMRPLMEGFAIGWIEAAVWLSEHHQCDELMREGFAVNLGKYLRELLTGNFSPMTLNVELSGRLSNVSGKFVRSFDHKVVITKLFECEKEDKGSVRILKEGDGVYRIASEICLKNFLALHVYDQVCQSLGKKDEKPALA